MQLDATLFEVLSGKNLFTQEDLKVAAFKLRPSLFEYLLKTSSFHHDVDHRSWFG